MSEPRTIYCATCERAVDKVSVQAGAKVTTKAVVVAEVDLAELGRLHTTGAGRHYLLDFDLDDVVDQEPSIEDHTELDLDDPDLVALCYSCSTDVTDTFRELVQ